MKKRRTKKIKESVVLILVIIVSLIFITKWINSFRKDSDRILREHIIRGIGLDIKDRIDLAEKAIATLVENSSIIQCIEQPENQEQNPALNRVLESFRTISDSSLIYIMDKNGLVKCSTRYSNGKNLIGNNYSFRYYFRASIKGKVILYPAVGVTTGKRGIYMSRPVSKDDTIIGVAVIKIDMDQIDTILQNSGKILLLSSPDGIVFSSSSEDLLLKATKPLSPAIRKKIEINRQYPDLSPEVLNIRESYPIVIGQKSYRSLKRDIPIPDWELTILTPERTPLPSLSKSYYNLFTVIGLLILIIYIILQLIILYRPRK